MHRRGWTGGLPRPEPARAAAAAQPPGARHCWVSDPPGHPGTWPGLLAEWRRGPQGWQGRVVYAVAEGDRVHLVEEWLPAAVLLPVGR